MLKPKQGVSDDAAVMTGITNEMLEKNGRQISDILLQIRVLLGESALIGHHVTLAVAFLNRALQEMDQKPIENSCFDTLEMYEVLHKLQEGGKNLENVL